ncbi:methyltransferase [Thermodesulfobacteriota bacterium]
MGSKREIRAHGIRVLLSQHPEIRRLKRQYIPSAHGNKLWNSSWLLMEYFRRRGLPEGSRVMEVGCGWGLAGIYCAKKHGALVTGVDIDPEVLPFMRLHGEINGVDMEYLKRSFNGLYRQHLKGVDVLIGADICFWDKMVQPLKRLILRAQQSGVRLVLIADPGRAPFEKIGEYFIANGTGKTMDWTTQRPRRIQGRLMEVSF